MGLACQKLRVAATLDCASRLGLCGWRRTWSSASRLRLTGQSLNSNEA